MSAARLVLRVWNARKAALDVQIVRELVDVPVGYRHRTGRPERFYVANTGVGVYALARKCVRVEAAVAECAISGRRVCLPAVAYAHALAGSLVVPRTVAACVAVALTVLCTGGGATIWPWPHFYFGPHSQTSAKWLRAHLINGRCVHPLMALLEARGRGWPS